MLLLNKNHPLTLMFNNYDGVIVKDFNVNNYYFTLQSFFYDYKILLKISSNSYFFSTSTIYKGNTWLEREVKEHSLVNFINLEDSRKLLLNYTYSLDLNYNNFNGIVNDILV